MWIEVLSAVNTLKMKEYTTEIADVRLAITRKVRILTWASAVSVDTRKGVRSGPKTAAFKDMYTKTAQIKCHHCANSFTVSPLTNDNALGLLLRVS